MIFPDESVSIIMLTSFYLLLTTLILYPLLISFVGSSVFRFPKPIAFYGVDDGYE